MTTHRGWAAALPEWEQAIGATHVERDAAALREASTATFATASHVIVILRPATREEVQACVRIANRWQVPLYPISTGKNWGYGSRVPTADSVLLDLGRMNRIADFSEELGYVTIEPGVTQRQLHEFLRTRESRLWMDATGASPDCSIIGNTLERGFGHTPMGDHCGNASAFEVVLPSGDCIDTGFGRFAHARAAAMGRYGLGPALDGLFSQSNLGIVTRMSVWLMPAPESFAAFFFTCQNEEDLGPVIDALRPLRMNGTLRSVMHIGNDYKVLTATSRFPWSTPGVTTPLDRADMESIRKQLSVGCWSGSGGLYGTARQVKEARRLVRRALKGKVARLHFVDDRLLGLARRFANPFRLLTGWDIRPTLTLLKPVYHLLKGVPTESTLASAYWRKKGEVPSRPDPDRDGCGLLWCSPVVPSTGEDAMRVTQLASDTMLAHGFEPQMSISVATERSLICVITVSYDRDVAGEDEKAMRCYTELTERLLAAGYPPYRLNVESMGYVAGGSPAYAAVLDALKSTLDPQGILAPGRYDGRAGRASEPAERLAYTG